MVETPESFKVAMCDIANIGDDENSHRQADIIMGKVLRKLGYHEGVDIFERMAKWY